MLETKPLELIYQDPTNISQVLSPFSASPPKVLLSGFRSRCHIVVKGAFPDFRLRQGRDQLIHLYTLAGFRNEELHTMSSQILIQHQNLQTHEQKRSDVYGVRMFLFAALVFEVCCSNFLVSSSCSLAQTRFSAFLRCVFRFIMDHTQSREFHHHLARAIMHLNCLAGFLPFFEPAIEWDDPMGEPYTRTGRSNPAQRNLHTFVPLPSSSSVPTLASHGGIPTHMILNTEPNLRPLSISSRPRDEEVHPAIAPALRNPVSESSPPPAPGPRLPDPDTPRVATWTTAVPVRSKQRSNHPDDAQPKKKQRSGDIMVHSSASRLISLPVIIPMFLMKASIQMIQMKKWFPESTQFILRQQWMPPPQPSLPPHQLTAQSHQLQEIQL